jgi:hypothetical protein
MPDLTCIVTRTIKGSGGKPFIYHRILSANVPATTNPLLYDGCTPCSIRINAKIMSLRTKRGSQNKEGVRCFRLLPRLLVHPMTHVSRDYGEASGNNPPTRQALIDPSSSVPYRGRLGGC